MMSLDSEDDSEEADTKDRKATENAANSDNETAGNREREETGDGNLQTEHSVPVELNMNDICGDQEAEHSHAKSAENEVNQTIHAESIETEVLRNLFYFYFVLCAT